MRENERTVGCFAMDVAVCGAQVPFMRGGAELHMENLVRALEAAGHRAELIRLPTAWDRRRIFDAALAWRLVPVDADIAIATNFPSYFVRHDRKVVWLFHQHRAAYDAVERPWSDFTSDDEALEAQRLLTEWDNRALEEASRLFTTSREVAHRLARFNGLEAEPLYHPPPLHDRLHRGAFSDYVFCPTRLERNKRPELMVRAIRDLTSETRVCIAGQGSMRDALLADARATGRPERVELLGFVDDAYLIDLYANALAVVYAPVEEDYGYVTLQAFSAGKPVITATDSGGVLEWVEDGVSGLVTDGSAAGVAAAIDKLAFDRDFARALGEEGRKRVAELDWNYVVRRLLD
jgi:glycosyltransferase involved in cell wall biosynthesis